MVVGDGNIKIRKVKGLGGRAREKALEQGFDEEDLVIVKTTINSLPEYEVERIEGSITEYLEQKYLK